MTEKLILEKLVNLETHSEKMEQKVDKLESAISTLAVQSERLDHLSGQTKALWEKFDLAFAPGGYVEGIKTHQAGCPKETMKTRFKELWIAYALIAVVIIRHVWTS